MDWARILAFVTGMVDQELLARNEYLAAENRMLKAQLKGRLKLSDAEASSASAVAVTQLDGKWRMSQNRDMQDRDGVATPKAELHLIGQRLKRAREDYEQWARSEKPESR